MRFEYELVGPGWAEALVECDGCSARPTASYLTDALGDLLGAVVQLLEGRSHATCEWDEEPGLYAWDFQTVGDRVHVGIDADGIRDRADLDEEVSGVLFECRVTLRELANAIAAGAEKVFDEHGAAGYRRRWMDHGFPRAALRNIRNRVPRS